MDYREEMKQLRDFLNQQSYLYYVLDAPVIPDYEYDRLNRRLEELEAEHPEEITPDSPTQRVGDKILEGFETYEHPVPLESLQDVFNAEEVSEFLDRMREALGDGAAYSVEPKVDGLSVALEYRDGVFVRGATRGDGRVGEDVTENLKTIRAIPMQLPEKLPRLIVRGEVYMSRAVFAEINARRELEGKPLMANPRNPAAGSLRHDGGRLYPPTTALRRRAGGPHDGPEDHRHCAGVRLRFAGQLHQSLYPIPRPHTCRTAKKRRRGPFLCSTSDQSDIGRWSKHGLQDYEKRGVYGALPGKDVQV